MQLPTYTRIFKTDYPADEQDLISKLSTPINNSFQVIFQATSNNISLSDNIFCTVKQITVSVDSSGNPTAAASFQIQTTGIIQGITVLRAVNQTSTQVFPTSQPFISYSQNSTLINITNIAGLPTGNSFLLTCVAWG